MVAPTTATGQEPNPAATGQPATGDGGLFGGGWTTWILVALLAVMVFFMWRSSRKRKADAAKLQDSMRPGVDVMTSFGLFGKLVSVDELANTAEIELNPGNVVKVHRQTLVKVVDPTAAAAAGEPRSVEEAMEIAEREQLARETGDADDVDGEPRFGERVEKAEDAAEGDADGDAPKKS
ncbi:MAG: preprotein translocase subunit YajC [Microbacteriaceae bacterium]|nr:preprotein translocase subunit YajC [Microbacteriaceae bacterium]